MTVKQDRATVNDLLPAAKSCAKWMRWWIDQNDCDCEGIHVCGLIERSRELEGLERIIGEMESEAAK